MREDPVAVHENGAKVLGDMEAVIRGKLMDLCATLGEDYFRLHTAYIDMPDEIKANAMYKPLGDKISSVEALLNTLMHTAASFPMPVDQPATGIGTVTNILLPGGSRGSL